MGRPGKPAGPNRHPLDLIVEDQRGRLVDPLDVAISFVTARGREWLAHQNITFEQGANDDEIGECQICQSRQAKELLTIEGLYHNILYNVSQDINILIEIYEHVQNSKLIQANWELIVKAIVEYNDKGNYLRHVTLLKEIISHFSPKQLLAIFIKSYDNCRRIINPHIDWSCCYIPPSFATNRLQNSVYKLPHMYLRPNLTEAKLYEYLQDGYPGIRLPQNFHGTESYFHNVKSSPRIRALLSVNDVGTFTVKEYLYLPENATTNFYDL